MSADAASGEAEQIPDATIRRESGSSSPATTLR